MAMLGDVLAAARHSSGAFQAWLQATQPNLMARIRQAADPANETPTAFVRAAIADFARFASEEDWATLTSRIRNSDDPGNACLLVMVQWRLDAADCGAHRGHTFAEGTGP